MPADLIQATPEGFLVNPPDQRSNTQRIFVPRTALESLTVLAVIGATRRQRRAPRPAPSPHVRRVRFEEQCSKSLGSNGNLAPAFSVDFFPKWDEPQLGDSQNRTRLQTKFQ